MTAQLRIFTINRGMMDRFLEGWTKGVYLLREKHGFRTQAAWVNRERNLFFWLLSHDGPEDFEAADAAYYASAARAALDPDPAQYIARVEKWYVNAVPLP